LKINKNLLLLPYLTAIAFCEKELTPHLLRKTPNFPGQSLCFYEVEVHAYNDDGIPLIWLQDVSGFDTGPEAEK